jgi:putative NIF3 family GTP cyclohydrolase 1 type 2
MKLKELYRKAIEIGIDNDPRGREEVSADLERIRKEYGKLGADEKEIFDMESLQNPYSDSRILHGTGEEEIKHILVGIDIEVGEVLLAETLRKNGATIDLLFSHHPEGMAFANLYSVMHMQSDILSRLGVPINIAEDLMDGRAKEVERKLMPANHTRAVDAARLLGMPFVCLHTPTDNMVVTYLQRLFDTEQPRTLSDIMDILRGIPEYGNAIRNGSGPKIFLGSRNRRAGRIFVDMTGGTEGSKDIFSSLASAGINTIVAMHLSEEHRKEAENNHLNLVVAGHISSDNLGVNLLLDKLLHGESATILECSGFQRVSRGG